MSRTVHWGGAWPSRWPSPAAGRTPTAAPEVIAAGPLLDALWQALGDEAAPCASAPDVWTSDHPDNVAVAREGCTECPARRKCLAYAVAADATCGTWGGIDRTVRSGRRARRTDDDTEMGQSA